MNEISLNFVLLSLLVCSYSISCNSLKQLPESGSQITISDQYILMNSIANSFSLLDINTSNEYSIDLKGSDSVQVKPKTGPENANMEIVNMNTLSDLNRFIENGDFRTMRAIPSKKVRYTSELIGDTTVIYTDLYFDTLQLSNYKVTFYYEDTKLGTKRISLYNGLKDSSSLFDSSQNTSDSWDNQPSGDVDITIEGYKYNNRYLYRCRINYYIGQAWDIMPVEELVHIYYDKETRKSEAF